MCMYFICICTYIRTNVCDCVRIDVLCQLLRMLKFSTVIVNLYFYSLGFLKIALSILIHTYIDIYILRIVVTYW